MPGLQLDTKKRRSGGLLGSPGSELQLRFVGTRRDREIVDVDARKCLIGAADHCTLKLVGPGVQAVHCLVLRGERGVGLRSLTPATTLNGSHVRDAQLRHGDRLGVGPYELEVLAQPPAPPVVAVADQPDPAAAPVAAAPHPLEAAIDSRIRRLEDQLRELQQQHEQHEAARRTLQADAGHAQNAITQLLNQLESQRQHHADEQQELRDERQRLAAELKDAARDVAELSHNLHQARQQLDQAETQRLQHQERAAELSARVDQLVRQIDEIEQRQQHDREQWHTEKERLQAELATSHEQLAELERQLEQSQRRCQDAEAQRHQLDAHRDELQQAVDRLTEQLQHQQQQHGQQQSAWDARRAELESQLREAAQRPAELELPDDEPQAASAPAESPEDLPASSPEGHDSHAARRNLESRLAGLMAEREALEQGRPAAYELETVPLPLPAAGNDFDRPLGDELGTTAWEQTGELPSDPFAAADPLGNLPPTAEPPAPQAAPPQGGLAETVAADALRDDDQPPGPVVPDGEEIAFQAPSSASPVNTADVLARLGQAEARSDDPWTNPPPAAGPTRHDVAEPGSAWPPATPADEITVLDDPAPEPRHDHLLKTGHDEPEESIESYMAQLLQRVRGGDAPAAEQRRELRAPIVEEDWEEKPAPVAAETPPPSGEYRPRTPAPELMASLAAMRALANDTARSAIVTHDKKSWLNSAKVKLMGMFAGAVAAVASSFFLDSNPLLAAIGVMAGLGATICWGWQALTLQWRSRGWLKGLPHAAPRRERVVAGDAAGEAGAAAPPLPDHAEAALPQ